VAWDQVGLVGVAWDQVGLVGVAWDQVALWVWHGSGRVGGCGMESNRVEGCGMGSDVAWDQVWHGIR